VYVIQCIIHRYQEMSGISIYGSCMSFVYRSYMGFVHGFMNTCCMGFVNGFMNTSCMGHVQISEFNSYKTFFVVGSFRDCVES